ncbi:hypothetical protein F5984_04525 [Rudanella paleaurantiibacter]|uniref:Uncharacterized protein n=1 Tax=Rudanella paleaurantiibacter TaxID=2614655 RepID=A0A7J5U6B9_9BACT|nr:hypothetical protein [Rudanella paleaurantiibacter]KAB7733201.1 hypothetical protein F5984_04525 [Rudanella paleaurantiibacter]
MKTAALLFGLLFMLGCRSTEWTPTLLRVANVAADTSFHLDKTAGSKVPRITLCAVGYLDDSASIILVNPRQPEKLYWRVFSLPKGRIDSLKSVFDYYDFDVNIHYQSQRVRRGNLRVVVKY